MGKSSLFRRFTTNSFVTATDRTVTLGLDNYGKVFEVSSLVNFDNPEATIRLGILIVADRNPRSQAGGKQARGKLGAG